MFVDLQFATKCNDVLPPSPASPGLTPRTIPNSSLLRVLTNGYTIAPHNGEKRPSSGQRETGQSRATPQACFYIYSIFYCTNIYLHLDKLRTHMATKRHTPHLHTPWRITTSPPHHHAATTPPSTTNGYTIAPRNGEKRPSSGQRGTGQNRSTRYVLIFILLFIVLTFIYI
jgi:hypothetical protein